MGIPALVRRFAAFACDFALLPLVHGRKSTLASIRHVITVLSLWIRFSSTSTRLLFTPAIRAVNTTKVGTSSANSRCDAQRERSGQLRLNERGARRAFGFPLDETEVGYYSV